MSRDVAAKSREQAMRTWHENVSWDKIDASHHDVSTDDFFVVPAETDIVSGAGDWGV